VVEETFDDVQTREEAIPWQDVVLPFLAVVTLIGVALLWTATLNACCSVARWGLPKFQSTPATTRSLSRSIPTILMLLEIRR
jgi:hypothetical protein